MHDPRLDLQPEGKSRRRSGLAGDASGDLSKPEREQIDAIRREQDQLATEIWQTQERSSMPRRWSSF